MAQAIQYKAFLSYSHADTTMAKRVHGRLEGFRIDNDLVGRHTPTGTIEATLRPIFRDRNEFDAGASLADQTIAALDRSAAQIVLASPNAAQSKYVNEEIRLFKSRHPDRPIIPLIIAGRPGHPDDECFPPALRSAIDTNGNLSGAPVEVLAADLRESGDGLELALSKVVARLIGLPTDEVYRRADRERRRQTRLVRRVQALIVTLMAGIIVGLIGWINQAYLYEQWRWYSITRPYMVSQIRPYVLSAQVEQRLKAKDEFKECAVDEARPGDQCPLMVVVPAGSFTMGSSKAQPSKDAPTPAHKVVFARPFAVSKFEVTFDEWDTCVAYGDCDPKITEANGGRGRQPLANVTWLHTQQYISWLSKVTGKTYRLLSEAEWEYAARAGTQTDYYWGDKLGKDNANCAQCGSPWDSKRSAPVGSFSPNQFGLHDMLGNVSEWVEDCEHVNYNGAPLDGAPWVSGGNCDARITRGGDWVGSPEYLVSWKRIAWPVDFRLFQLGFRVARTITK
jgi:formylglycine-generating enzyme required for sulfatase activity